MSKFEVTAVRPDGKAGAGVEVRARGINEAITKGTEKFPADIQKWDISAREIPEPVEI